MFQVLVQDFLPSESIATFYESYRMKGNGLLHPEPSDLSACQVLCNLPFHSFLIMSVMRFIMLVQHFTE